MGVAQQGTLHVDDEQCGVRHPASLSGAVRTLGRRVLAYGRRAAYPLLSARCGCRERMRAHVRGKET
ncbi:hypothetical protein GCM10010335_08050 [Streptomyces galbus]|nr:hypothetical protein GCM10010335_08050 [Streptomyces galbus]